MDTISKLPDPSIHKIIGPTVAAFVPLLIANSKAILDVKSSTHQYGSHPRQHLDIYPSVSDPSSSPILIFFYGGGLTRGDKINRSIPDGLVYRNLGAFFAQRGYTTVIPDYRRVNATTVIENKEVKTGEDAVFPSGGEDLSAAISWLQKSDLVSAGESRDLFVMGNSAGGVHLSTYLFHGDFLDQRRALLEPDAVLKLRGAILLSVPMDSNDSPESRRDMISTYWPVSSFPVTRFQPNSLLRNLAEGGKSESPDMQGIPPLLALHGDLEPDEIMGPMDRLAETWREVFGSKGLEFLEMKGHNHLSPPYALMSNDKRAADGLAADQWGADVIAWMNKAR